MEYYTLKTQPQDINLTFYFACLQIDDTWQVSLERMGLRVSPEQLYDEASMTYLTNNSIAFAKALLLFTGDTIALLDGPSHALIASALRDVVTAHRRHVANALATTKLKSDVSMRPMTTSHSKHTLNM